MEDVPSNLSNLKNKVHISDVDKLVYVPVDLSKNDVVKKDLYNVKIKGIENKIPDITNVTTNTTLNVKINRIKGSIIDLGTTDVLNVKINEVKGK